MNKMCFKITLAMLCFFSPLSFKVQLQQPNLRGLCLAQCCISIILSLRSPELYQQNLCQNIVLVFCFRYELFGGEIQDMASLSLVYPRAVK